MSHQHEETPHASVGDQSIALFNLRTSILQAVGRIIDLLCLWHDRAAERAHLISLPDYLLRDMGITREQVEVEAAKPFWKV